MTSPVMSISFLHWQMRMLYPGLVYGHEILGAERHINLYQRMCLVKSSCDHPVSLPVIITISISKSRTGSWCRVMRNTMHGAAVHCVPVAVTSCTMHPGQVEGKVFFLHVWNQQDPHALTQTDMRQCKDSPLWHIQWMLGLLHSSFSSLQSGVAGNYLGAKTCG